MSGREFSDEELDRLTRQRHRIVLAELEQEEAMSKSIPRPPHYRDMGESPPPPPPSAPFSYDPPPGYEPPPPRWLAWGLIVFWALVIGGITLLYSCKAEAEGFQVYLEGEDDLGNGFKLCHYTEGVTITVRDSQLCPLSIKVP